MERRPALIAHITTKTVFAFCLFLSVTAGTFVASASNVRAATFTRPLVVGSQGSDVTALQQILNSQGFLSTTPTGYFGALTAKALAAFQTAHSIDPLGGVGPLTRTLLNTLVSSNNPSTTASVPTSPSTSSPTATSFVFTRALVQGQSGLGCYCASGNSDCARIFDRLRYRLLRTAHRNRTQEVPDMLRLAKVSISAVSSLPTVRGTELTAASQTQRRAQARRWARYSFLRPSRRFRGRRIRRPRPRRCSIRLGRFGIARRCPSSGRRWALCTRRSRIAPAKVGSTISRRSRRSAPLYAR